MMIKINLVDRLKVIVLCAVMVSSSAVFAQSDKSVDASESTIVMTKSELDSFLSKIADARRAELKKRDQKNAKQELAELRYKYQQRNQMQSYQMQPSGYDSGSNEQILRELRYINQRIDNLSANSNAYPSNNRDNSTIIIPGNTASNPMNVPSERNTTTVIPAGNKKIAALEATIDSLKNAQAMNSYRQNSENKDTYRQENKGADSLAMMKGRLSDVRRQMQLLELKMNASSNKPVKEDTKKVVKEEEKTYFKQQVYFDNNSEKLKDEYIKYVQDLTQILMKFPEAKVMLEGWASPKGTVLYNKQISMRRTESVEKAFLNNGIDSNRIINSFRGEDTISSEQHARRVDMSIIVR